MAIASGLAAQIGFVAESTFGTRATPTKFVEFANESLKLTRERIETAGLRAGRRTLHRWAAGKQEVTGQIQMELPQATVGLLFKHFFGTVNTTGSNPYVHTFTPGTTDDKSLTIQVGRPSSAGTVTPFDYLGCSLTDLDLSYTVGDWVKATWGVYGIHEDTAQSLASASYSAAYAPFAWTQASVTLAGSDFAVMSADLKIARGLKTGRHFIRATTPERPKIALEGASLMDVTGTLVADFDSLTAYNRFVSGTEAALVLTANAGASASLVITLNVRFDGETPVVDGPDMLKQSLPFKAVSSTSDAAAITAVLTNADTTP